MPAICRAFDACLQSLGHGCETSRNLKISTTNAGDQAQVLPPARSTTTSPRHRGYRPWWNKRENAGLDVEPGARTGRAPQAAIQCTFTLDCPAQSQTITASAPLRY